MDELNKLVDEKLTADTDFQTSLSTLTDEEKTSSIENKRKEVFDAELKTISEQAKEAAKNKEIAKNQEARAKKAEDEVKKLKPQEKKADDDRLSTTDFYALTKASVLEEDIPDVAEYAKFKGISIADALKSSAVKAIISEKTETRRVAQATNTRSTRSQDTGIDGNAVLQDARTKGEDAMPEVGSKEAEAMFWARRGKSQPK